MILKEEHINSQGRREVSKHGLVNIDLSQFAPIATVDSSLTGTEPITPLVISYVSQAQTSPPSTPPIPTNVAH
ncbi:hypothetical protein BY996DRAFT_6556929 [Phakopsora pachyrhizi]|nr:hypothetical protein BY996DRAFT_6556929 [Phakopsora pachyrhizi]